MSEFIETEHLLPPGTVTRFRQFLRRAGVNDSELERIADIYLRLADDITRTGTPTTPEYLYMALNKPSANGP